MGNYKFRILDMIPSGWFHKLKDMTKHKTKTKSSSNTCSSKKKPSLDSLPHHSSTTSSYLLISNIPQHNNSPRNSLHTKRMSKRKTLYKPSLKSLKESKINGQDSSEFLFPSLEISPESFVYSFYQEKDDDEVVFEPSNFKINTKNTKHMNVKETSSIEKACHARNIKNKPRKSHLSVKIKKGIEEEKESKCREEKKHYKKVSSGRKSSAGINLKRVTSPRIQQLSSTRRSTSRLESKQCVLESFAVMKSSVNPKKDFRESMVEMIEENNIRDPKDLEDLLACYLSLNPKEYHDLIVHVFEQIWRQLIKTK